MNNKQFYPLKKHFTKTLSTIILVLIVLTMCACTYVNTTDKPSSNNIPVEQNFSISCPILADGTFDNSKMKIEFKNTSLKNITSWVGAILYYDTNGNTIKGSQGNLLWGIKGDDNIAPSKSSTWEYSLGTSNLAQARVYLYYICFNDNTTWGQENLSETDVIKYGTFFSIQRDLSQYYSGQCGLVDSEGDSEKSQIVSGYAMVLNLKNNSSQSIIAYEAIVIQYNVYGDKLKGSSESSVYKTIKCQPVGFEPNKSDFNTYTYYSKTNYAEVYVYYVLFNDRTSWGYRENITPLQALKYGTKFTLYRT